MSKFYSIAKKSPNGEFQYYCTNCGTIIGIKKRITQNKRRCPECGVYIKVLDIDEQVKKEYPAHIMRESANIFLDFILTLSKKR